MKKQILILAVTLVTTNLYSQGGSDNWKTDGNNPQAGSFLGTLNDFPINFRVNNVQKMVLDPIGDLQLSNLAGTGNRVLMSDATGKLMSLPTGIAGQFLQSNGTWGSLPGGATSWQLNGSKLISTNTGNVGIGTSNPEYKLDVSGSVRITNNLFVGGGVITTSVVNTSSQLNAGDVNATNNLNVTGASNLSGNVTLSNNLIFGGAGSNNGISYTPPNGGIPPVWNFGPLQEFPVDPELFCGGLNPPPSPPLITAFLGEIQTYNSVNVGAPLLKMGASPTSGYIESRSAPLAINKWCKNYIYLLGLRVGFGTETPSEKFHFSGGNILLDGINSLTGNSFTKLTVQGALDNTGLTVTTNHSPASGNYNTLLNVDQNDSKALTVRMNPTGYENFMVFGNGKTNVGWMPGSQNLAKLNVNLNGGPAINVYDQITNQVSFDVKANGQTFIGNPLQTNGSMLTVAQPNANALAFALTDNSVNPNRNFLTVLGNGYTEIKVYNPLSMPAPVGGSPRAFAIKDMANNGRDLFVVNANGKTCAREVEITLSATFPDYVFANDYKLKSLSEVDAFIKENHHLPNFNKGEYYEKNGINVTDMILMQQKTIEELTLYNIQLEKRLNALEEKIKK